MDTWTGSSRFKLKRFEKTFSLHLFSVLLVCHEIQQQAPHGKQEAMLKSRPPTSSYHSESHLNHLCPEILVSILQKPPTPPSQDLPCYNSGFMLGTQWLLPSLLLPASHLLQDFLSRFPASNTLHDYASKDSERRELVACAI